MPNPTLLEVRVGLEEFEISHGPDGFQEFFSRIEAHAGNRHVAVAMEGYNGHARPLDSLVMERAWRLFNVNNLKLARFKEIFPGAAKSDRLDSRKTLVQTSGSSDPIAQAAKGLP